MVTKEDDVNKDLTRRIDADLKAKMEGTTRNMDEGKDPDFAEDAEYVKDFKKTGKFAWVFVVLGVAAVVALIIVGLNH
ncbi:hypothetical protein IJJ37_01875 [Candidatus Saccharibacteria bacterium]|nr:hypothetical protein [Candidatus Saccharibacteria bacterium]